MSQFAAGWRFTPSKPTRKSKPRVWRDRRRWNPIRAASFYDCRVVSAWKLITTAGGGQNFPKIFFLPPPPPRLGARIHEPPTPGDPPFSFLHVKARVSFRTYL